HNAIQRDRSVRVRQVYFNANNNNSRDRFVSRCVLRKGLAEHHPKLRPPAKACLPIRSGVSRSKSHPAPPHGEVYSEHSSEYGSEYYLEHCLEHCLEHHLECYSKQPCEYSIKHPLNDLCEHSFQYPLLHSIEYTLKHSLKHLCEHPSSIPVSTSS